MKTTKLQFSEGQLCVSCSNISKEYVFIEVLVTLLLTGIYYYSLKRNIYNQQLDKTLWLICICAIFVVFMYTEGTYDVTLKISQPNNKKQIYCFKIIFIF
jgi:Ca2+/Na+ antiporter